MNNFINKLKTLIKNNIDIIKPTLVLTVICIVVTLALSLANTLTYKTIEKRTQETQKQAMSKVLDGDYTKKTENIDGNDVEYYLTEKDGETVGFIFTVERKGYGGDISVMTAVKNDGTVAAVQIVSADNETVGLGQNVTKEAFYGQFEGLGGNITVKKSGTANKQNGEIDAVTGATISSKAVTDAVNTALEYAEQIIAKGDFK